MVIAVATAMLRRESHLKNGHPAAAARVPREKIVAR
jgi:hypothetical protein